MKKLIATEFTYSYTDRFDGRRHNGRGSYLGRKEATEPTLRRFMNKNFRDSRLQARIVSVQIFSSYESRWVAK